MAAFVDGGCVEETIHEKMAVVSAYHNVIRVTDVPPGTKIGVVDMHGKVLLYAEADSNGCFQGAVDVKEHTTVYVRLRQATGHYRPMEHRVELSNPEPEVNFDYTPDDWAGELYG